ncbi:MAG: glycogen debranching protein [Phycisphaerales bacterium]|nr:glycogen debranching protein [Phycisphaerales bacterium]
MNAFAPDAADAWLSREFLLTDGLGGSTLLSPIGACTRRYHGLLVAAACPPVGRRVVLKTLIERFEPAHDPPVELSTHEFGPDRLRHPDGWRALASFELMPPHACVWTYRLREGVLRRHVERDRGRARVTVTYALTGAATSGRLVLRPITPMRGVHEVASDPVEARLLDARTLEVASPAGVARLIHDGDGVWQIEPERWRDFHHRLDAERGFFEREDAFCPGRLQAVIAPDVPLTLTCELLGASPPRSVVTGLGPPPTCAPRAAADQFVTLRRDGERWTTTIMAGYPWFADWGRDAMISLPGLLLETGRYDAARSVLETFASHERDGLLPNCFLDDRPTQYNAADAPLWFVHALWAYARVSGDDAIDPLLDTARAIVAAYRRGTDFDIGCDDDGLVNAGDGSVPLTWMDAYRDGVAMTPRAGKPVELSALWYHALNALAELVPGDAERRDLERQARRTRGSFARFWWPERRCLCDGLGSAGPDTTLRPNQLFAVGLPHSPLDAAQQRGVVDVVERMLLTPYGLRTLAPDDPRYVGRFEGDLWQRDQAYHNGTVWPWLIGVYVDAVLRVAGKAGRQRAAAALAPLLATQAEGMGQIAEVYDGDAPHRPGGCPAQAWSVAEVNRAQATITTTQKKNAGPRSELRGPGVGSE